VTPAERSAKFKAAHPERAAIYSARYYETHKAEIKARNEAWRAANPDKVKAQGRAWLEANRERSRATGRRWYAAHPEYYANRRSAYAAANRDRLSEIENRRRARKLGNGVFTITARDWRRVLHRYRNACAYCGATGVPLDQDHVIPISRGGRHSIGNLVPACDFCNGSKSARLLAEWRYRRYGWTGTWA
jgi:5-methylcytosine-specific restriction endonuclease McrA